MDTLTLAEPIAAYFAAKHNSETLAYCFMAQAVIKNDLSDRFQLERGLIAALEVTA
jgi:hypothetical protein